VTAPRDPMPSLGAIQSYWDDHWDELLATFPEIRARSIGWGEPFCFRCGWLAPVKPATTAERVPQAWNSAAGWLDRCHLQDHAEGGSEDPSNLAPMCMACHRWQPVSETREDGIAYVNEPVRVPTWLQVATDRDLASYPKDGHKDLSYWRVVGEYFESAWRGLVEGVRRGNPATRDSPEFRVDSESWHWPRGPRYSRMLAESFDDLIGPPLVVEGRENGVVEPKPTLELGGGCVTKKP